MKGNIIMKLRRILAVILAMLTAFGMLASCSAGNAGNDTTSAPITTDNAENTTDSEAAADTTAPDTEVPADDIDIRIGTLKGPTGMGMAKLINDSEGTRYKVEVYSAPDDVTAALISGSLEAAALPVNLAAVINKKTGGDYIVAAVNTLGVLYVIENGDTVQSIQDLRGKTLYATGQGSTPEYVLRYILSSNGIDPDKDITIEYKTEHSELATLMASGDIKLGMLPEPNVTSVLVNNEKTRIALDLTSEWDALGLDSALVQGCIVVKKSFAEEHTEQLVRFLADYKASVEYVNSNPDEASEMIAAAGIIPKAALAKKAIPNCNIVYIDGAEMVTMLSDFYDVLFNANPASLGGTLPDENLYWLAQ